MAIHYVDLASGNDGTTKTISGATKANPCVVTCNAHGFSNGDTVFIYGVAGMTQLNQNRYTVQNQALNTFELAGIDSTGYSTYTSGGSATIKGTATTPFLTVNAAVAAGVGGNDIRVAKTTAATSVACSGAGVGWTANSVTVTTSSDLRGSIAVGDYIGKTTAAGNGAEETFWRVNAITASTITLEQKYGGTTATEASCLKANPVTTGGANAVAMTMTAGTLSGGWNLSGSPTQDGETWFKPNGTRTTNTLRGIDVTTNSGQSVSKMNVVEAYYGVYENGVTVAIANCTMHGYAIGLLTANLAGCSVDACVASYVTGNSAFYLQNAPTVTNCIGIGTICFSYYSAGITFTGCKAVSGATGWNGTVVYNLVNCECRNMSTVGATGMSANSYVTGSTFKNCAIGIQTATSQGGIFIKSCTFDTCTSGVSVYQCHGVTIDACTFTAGTYHVNAFDQYSGDVLVKECSFNTPGTFAIYRNTMTGRIVLTGCTIDGGSIAKAYNVTASPYLVIQYVLVGSFGQSGTICGNASILQDSTTYRTTAPSLAISWVSTTTTSNLDIKVVSAYVASGVAKTYTMYLKASNASWSGTVTPKWKLNGVTIKTESNITSLTTSWVQYSWTCAADLITSAGELAIEFTPNMNNYSIYVDDFTVT